MVGAGDTYAYAPDTPEAEARRLAESTSIRPEQADVVLAAARSTPLAHSVRIAEVARRQDVSLGELFRAAGVGTDLPRDAIVSTELELKYAGYFCSGRSSGTKRSIHLWGTVSQTKSTAATVGATAAKAVANKTIRRAGWIMYGTLDNL